MDLERESVREILYDRCPDLSKIRENPNGWPIIKKYNRRIFNKYSHDIFKIIEATIENSMVEYFKSDFDKDLVSANEL